MYSESSEASLLEKLPKCRNQGINSISHETMANLIIEGIQPYIIVDCRFDYEYNGGHIQGAINFSEES